MLDLSQFPSSRVPILQEEFTKPYFLELQQHLQSEYEVGYTIFPAQAHIFQAFELTAFDKVRVVILGQDPYHGPHQAHGLAFSVFEDAKIPPSLRNIYKELRQEGFINYQDNSPLLREDGKISGKLTRWAEQGVLLLNAILTVRANEAGSHRDIGWETFTDAVISKLSQQRTGIVFLLWGKFAQSKKHLIDNSKHFILTAVHPSPLSAHSGWFGNNHFRQANEYLENNGLSGIAW